VPVTADSGTVYSEHIQAWFSLLIIELNRQ